MQIFITGGSGLVGRHLIPRLLEQGHDVLCLSRSPEKAIPGLPPATKVVAGDPIIPGDWQNEVAVSHAVINLAGESVATGLWTPGKKKRLRRSRLSCTANLLDAMAGQDRPAVLISASATGYYGDAGDTALGEDHEPGRGFLARLALEWEHTAQQAASESTRVVLLRIGVVLARDGGALPKLMMPFRFGLGGPLGSGRQYFPWIHITDLVRAIEFALETTELEGPVNAVAPLPPTQREFTQALASALGKRVGLSVPGWVLRNVLGEKAEMFLASQRAVPNALKVNGFKFLLGKLDEALADLVGEGE